MPAARVSHALCSSLVPSLVSEITGRARRFPGDVSVTCVIQDDGASLSLPASQTRTRPRGTVHAVIVAGSHRRRPHRRLER